jgi:nickel-dependent lactate racemase
MEYFAEGSEDTVIDKAQAAELVDAMLEQLGPLRRVLIVPPDYTRARSYAGELTVVLYERLEGRAHVEIMPALGTHAPMTADEIDAMFPGIAHEVFRVHDWRRDLVRLGEVPGEFVREVSDGKLDYPIACEVNRLLVEGEWDRIISVGQLVPHEVAGIANQNKNVFIGAGGADTINKTHFLGAAYGMERMMGRADTPVRRVLDYMTEQFGGELPIAYVLTVRARDTSRETDPSGRLVTRGLFGGDDAACFARGAELCRRVNVDLLDEPIAKAVVYLDAGEFKSTWLGNKAIYRTRMAMADGGELIILAPGVREFGEDAQIDRLIRMHGYRGTPRTLEAVGLSDELAANLSAAAHLIHGSSEGRFTITYCPGHLSRDAIEGVGFRYANLDEMMKRYDPQRLRDGYNTLPDGERVFFVSNPGLGLWALRSQFEE